MKSLRPLLSFVLLIFLCASASGADGSAGDVLGRYWLPDRDGQFEIYEKNGRYFGRVVTYDKPEQLDENNEDESLRSRRFLGIDMFTDFQFDPDENQWVDGEIYDGTDGRTYDCYMWFEDGEPNFLVARGFIGISFFGRNATFARVLSQE